MWDNKTWEIIRNWNTFAPWLSGIGSLSAVIVSLWLVRRDKSIRLLVETGYSTAPLQTPAVRVTVTNVGTRKANVADIYVKAGAFRPVVDFPLPFQLRTAPVLPASLDDGDFIDIDLPIESIAIQLKTTFQNTAWWNGGRSANVFLRTVKIGVRTSTGKAFEANLSLEGAEVFLRRFRLSNELI